MIPDYQPLLDSYSHLPDRVEAAIRGLTLEQLDLTSGKGWSIRAYVHHIVEGELLWQVNLRVIIGLNGIHFPFDWYFKLSQDEWADHWAYQKRAIEPSLSLFRGSTSSLVDLLRNMDANVWENCGYITWLGDTRETCITVREIFMNPLGHVDGHLADIMAIRKIHGC